MILSDGDIIKARDRGAIVVRPWRDECLGPNSYDVHLGARMITHVYPGDVERQGARWVSRPTQEQVAVFRGLVPGTFGYATCDPNPRALDLDFKRESLVWEFEIGESGYVLVPGVLYLAVTEEYTESREHLPYLDGKSSLARAGLSIHETAGRGDVGFCGHWTLEITVVHPTRVYPGMPIGQIAWHEVSSPPRVSYDKRTSSTYAVGSHGPAPVPSGLWKKLTAKPVEELLHGYRVDDVVQAANRVTPAVQYVWRAGALREKAVGFASQFNDVTTIEQLRAYGLRRPDEGAEGFARCSRCNDWTRHKASDLSTALCRAPACRRGSVTP